MNMQDTIDALAMALAAVLAHNDEAAVQLGDGGTILEIAGDSLCVNGEAVAAVMAHDAIDLRDPLTGERWLEKIVA